MSARRGDVVLAWFPFASGAGSKRRPCVVVQNDLDNAKLTNTIVVQIPSNLARAADKSHFLIDIGSTDGQKSGLLHDSVVSCNNIATIEQSLIDRAIGTLTPPLLTQLDACLKNALDTI
jgi:mRNA interferase MazF